MWKWKIFRNRSRHDSYRLDNFKELLSYLKELAKHKLGFPVSLLTYLGIVNTKVFGIKSRSIANILLNNVGDPFKDSETSLLEVKRHEREILFILEKYFGLEQHQIKGYVTSGGTEGNFAALWWSKRYLINMGMRDIISTDDAIKLKLKEEQECYAQIAKIANTDYSERIIQLEKIVQAKNAVNEKREIMQQLLTPTAFYSKTDTHYSIPKIAEILRFNIKTVASNEDGSINLDSLHKEILIHVSAHPHSPIIVIANIGTTITGAIDNVPGIKKVILAIKSDMNYTIHMDGALSGFVMPILKPFGDVKNYFNAIGANSLAFSAHKYPGLSQPCGVILADITFFEKAFEKSERIIEYVGNILDYTVTGSRSGLNVLMFYHALCTLGINTEDKTVIKKLVNDNLTNARYLRDQLITLFGIDRVVYTNYFNVSFPRPSMALAKKYQLMLSGEKATICVLTNVTKQLIDDFLLDLKIDKENAMNSLKTNCKIVTLDKKYEEAALKLFVKCFCDTEPMTKHLGIEHKEYEPFAREVIKKAVADGLSKVAIDNNNEVVACALAEDMANPFKPDFDHYPKLEPIFTLLEDLSTPFTRGKKFLKGKILHIWIAAVDEHYRGQGLSTDIDMACVEGAAKNGFEFAYTEFTNPISEKVTKQFKVLHLCNKIKYSDYKLDGKMPFKGLEGESTSYVASLKPGIGLDALPKCYRTEEKFIS